MQNNLIHVGLDVDDSNYHGSAFNKATGEMIDFQCRPTLKGLLNQLDKLRKHFAEHVIKLCYEASYVGFTLQRDLTKKSFHCEVVAPNSIPRLQGKHIKTDRLDAIDLARYYANGLKSHWTKAHYFWLDKVLVEATGSFKTNLALVLRELRSIDAILHRSQPTQLSFKAGIR